MNWFLIHLNWTWVLAFLFVQGILWVAGAESMGGEAWIAGLAMLPVSSWVIMQKGRSLCWLLLSGVLSPLWLKNKTKKSGALNS